jgi:hypothetical protein
MLSFFGGMGFDEACNLVGFKAKESEVIESTKEFVSIPLAEWQQLRQSLTAMQAILFSEVQPVEFES